MKATCTWVLLAKAFYGFLNNVYFGSGCYVSIQLDRSLQKLRVKLRPKQKWLSYDYAMSMLALKARLQFFLWETLSVERMASLTPEGFTVKSVSALGSSVGPSCQWSWPNHWSKQLHWLRHVTSLCNLSALKPLKNTQPVSQHSNLHVDEKWPAGKLTLVFRIPVARISMISSFPHHAHPVPGPQDLQLCQANKTTEGWILRTTVEDLPLLFKSGKKSVERATMLAGACGR